MRALLWMGEGGFGVPGGHVTQLSKTAESLRMLGWDVEMTDAATEVPLDRVDVVHSFGISDGQIAACRSRGLPVVVSTIFWEWSYLTGAQRPLGPSVLLGRTRTALSLALASLRGKQAERAAAMLDTLLQQERAFAAADLLLPNSEAEAAAIRRDTGVKTPCHVVPNGIDVTELLLVPEVSKDLILIAGRIEPHKNTLATIRALRGLKTQVVVVGPAHPAHASYAERCRRASTDNVEFRGFVGREELVRLYRRARVNVLASWFETTGLTSLEAAASGAAIVTTERGFASSYFGTEASYCDPAKIRSIRQAVERALSSPPPPGLAGRVAREFSWAAAARATDAAYRRVLERPARAS